MMALGPAGPACPPWCPSRCCRRRPPQRQPPPPPTHTRKRWRRRKARECWWRVSGHAAFDSPSSSDDESPQPSYCYHSDTETNMPGGFENSAMKSSFSLSSLQNSSASLESPEHARLVERPYNSLRKTCRKDPEKDSWRRSWDRREVTKDEFWNALEPNYLYLMDCNLIDSCKEVKKDLHYGSSPSHDWSFDQFCAQFTELDQWLTRIQETIYSKEENVTDRNLRLSHVEEMHRKTYKRKVFNNQGGRLAARFPDLKDDVKWRMTHLNRKWERLEQTVTPRKHSRTEHTHLTHAIDVEHELNCLRKWLRLTERRLLPLNFHAAWTLAELDVKAKEHQVIQREVESHGKIVCSVLKRCDRLVRVEAEAEGAEPLVTPPDTLGRRRGRRDAAQAVRTARDLERRWQCLYIRSLEWLCHIENQTKRAKNKSPESISSLDSDEGEPVHKHPRLSSPWPSPDHDQPDYQDVDGDYLMDVSSSSANDMVGPQSELNSLPPSFGPSPPSPALLVRSGTTEDDVLNENFTYYNRRQSVPLDAARKLFSDESVIFTRSNRHAQNCATFYFKHCDTESEQEERTGDANVTMDTDNKNNEESSEEEWTYNCGQDSVVNDDDSFTHSTETLASAPRSTKQEPQVLPRPKLQKLIEGAVEIVHPSPTRQPREFSPLIFDTTHPKSKVNDWMMRDCYLEDGKTHGESCDASGEYTTEEEERQSSGDFTNTMFLPCHNSTEVLDTTATPSDKPSPSTLPHTPEYLKVSPVVLRAKRKEGTPKRPLSESGLPQMIRGDEKLLQCHSESALNQMDHTPTQSVKMDTSVHGTLSSSTTVEETPGTQTQEGSCGGYSTNSLRRRKLRKRNVGRKSESGSDNHDPPSPLKSPSTVTVRRRDLPHRHCNTDGTETEEDGEIDSHGRTMRRKCGTQPNFKLGPEGGLVTVFSSADKALSADSSFSEQAWDNYQEKYNSEAYSEDTPDQETSRRLLEFGEDYSKFIDSQSDGGASGLSFSRGGLIRRRRHLMDGGGQEVRSLISRSQSQLEHSEMAWITLSKANPHLVMAKDFAEIKSTCKENMSVLKRFSDESEQNNGFIEECKEMRSMIEQWRKLEMRTDELERMRSLQREMAALKEELLELTKRVGNMRSDNLEDRDQLEMKILQIKNEQGNLRERKAQLVEVNTAVHKFFTDSGQSEAGLEAAHRLKEDIKELYFVWDETNKRVSEQLESLSQLSTAWQALECQLTELQVALRTDQQTLRMLDSALQDGVGAQDVASSVIDVAKVLSEKQDLRVQQSVCALNATTPVILSLSEGSPESDSGISDSGSEQESERERRLSALRRLARQLEAVLSPNSHAIMDMTRRIEQTEVELRGLQKTCRELIVRTAVSVDSWTSPHTTSTPTPPTLVQRGKKNTSARDLGPQSFMELDPDSDPDDPDKTPVGWLWRVIRAALPFQMAILAIFCVACLLEPRCCDSMNNLNFSFTPQLRYPNGRPPM